MLFLNPALRAARTSAACLSVALAFPRRGDPAIFRQGFFDVIRRLFSSLLSTCMVREGEYPPDVAAPPSHASGRLSKHVLPPFPPPWFLREISQLTAIYFSKNPLLLDLKKCFSSLVLLPPSQRFC